MTGIRVIPVLGLTPADVTNGFFIIDLTEDPGEGKFVGAQAVKDFVEQTIDNIVTHTLSIYGTEMFASTALDESVPLDSLIVTDDDGNVVRGGT